ncbi:DsbA family protein, partial [Streptomyces africanus]|uniref:DsbA family protein n=1 Tax=Streptomyces africanus TaxID=231024 RepID=UPI003CC5A5E8
MHPPHPGRPCPGPTSGRSPGRLLRRCRCGCTAWENVGMSDSSPAPAAAPVLEVWCDLQCPDCRTALDDLHALRARYGNRLELRLRHFPL